MKFYLIVARGSKTGMPIPIAVDLFLIGSDPMCQLRKATLASKHCAIVVRAKKVFIQDLGRGDATIVNDEVLAPGSEWPLHAGDLIEVGGLQFMIQFREKPLSQRDLEEWASSCLDGDNRGEINEEADEYHKPTTASGAAQAIIDKLQAHKGDVKGQLRIGVEKGITIVRFNVRAVVETAEISLLRKELCDNLNRNNLRVLFDLKSVHRLSTAGVIMILEISRWLRPWGSKLALCRVQPELSAMMAMLHQEKIVSFPSRDAALAANW